MKCPNCQSANPEGAKFCNECGYNLTPTLGATSQAFSFTEKLAKIERYLPEGLTQKVLAQKDKIEGERRQITVMFCDMEGFTPLVEKLGPEEAYSLMDNVYELLIHEVSDYEGTVNELTGDGIMALFGAPIALENASQRALWSALSIHSAIAKFNDQNNRSMPIKMRIGVNSGPVVVGTLGNDLRVQFAAVGNTVNLASRMEGLAESGTTYVTEETYRQTSGLFRFEAIGEKSVKGKKEAVTIYKLLSSKKDVYRPGLSSERMIYSEMVGRDSALDRLELQVMKAINGEGSIVSIIGEAGIGKSRLVTELKKRQVMKRVTILDGRAISMGRNFSFHPIIDLLKQWARIREDDGEATALGNLEMAVRNVCPENLYEVLPFLATLMGMKLSGRYAERIEGLEGEALDNLILKSFRELLIKATELTPLVIVLEDMHWADTRSIELMESLFRLTETQNILFVNVFRPGHEETGDRIVETIRERFQAHYVEIVIGPLDRRTSEVLISNMLNIGEIHHIFIRKIVDRAGGNPFFIEEVVRSLIDESAVVLKDGVFHVTEKIVTMSVPYTINEVLMARIDRLEEKTRNLVKVAAVIGRNFFYRLVQEVADTVEDIEDRLSYLKEIQLIRERRRMGELEYLFEHTLAQEVAYESILPLKRKKLHLKVARSIENIFDSRLHEFYGMLAYHYSRAEDLDKTEEYLIKAGEEALKSSASNEALHYYREALSLYLKKYGDTAVPEKVAMLEKNIAFALYNRGIYDEAVEYFDKALNYYWGKAPKHAIPVTFKLLSAFLSFIIALYFPSLKLRRIPTQRDIDILNQFNKKCKALGIIDPKRFFIESLYICKEVNNFDLAAFDLGLKMFVSASSLFSFTGISFRFSRRILNFAKDRISKHDAKTYIIYELMEVFHNYFEGNWKAIENYDEDLVNKNLNIGEIYDVSQHLYWHGLSSIYKGSLGITRSMVNRLNDIIEVYENDFSLLLKYELNTNLLMECRRLPDALKEVKKGIDFSREAGLTLFIFDLYSFKVCIHILMGDMEAAEYALQTANEIKSQVDAVPAMLSTFYLCQFHYAICLLEKSIGANAKSESSEHRKKAIKLSEMSLKQSHKAVQHRTESYKLAGVYYWLINEPKNAIKWWHNAIEEGKRLGARLELSRVYFEVGKRLLNSETNYTTLNEIRAKDYLEMAGSLFEAMDLEQDLYNLSRVIKRYK